MARIDCNNNCSWIAGKQTICRAKRNCACQCNSLKVDFPTLHWHDACVDACNVDDDAKRPLNGMDWLCKNIEGEAVWSATGREYCGFDATKTKQAEQAKEVQKKLDAQTGTQNNIMIGAAILGGIIILGIFIKRLLK